MVSATREEHSYRRGLVLGLTMAEIVTLIIFVLLLALSALLARKDDEMARLVEELAQKETEILVLEEKSVAIDRFVSGSDDIESYFRELVLKRQEVDRLQKEKAALVEKSEALASELEQTREQAEAYRAIEEALVGAGLNVGRPEELTVAARQLEEVAALRDILESAGLDTDLAGLKEQLASLSAVQEAMGMLGDENATLRERMEYFRRMAAGRSNLLPPCWIDPESKKAEYIYDIALTVEGVVVYDRNLPHRREDKAELPLSRIVFQMALSNGDFLEQTRALFEWSDSEDCRFYVRVFDRTGATEKVLYKNRLRTVEGRFYKYEVTNPDIVPGI